MAKGQMRQSKEKKKPKADKGSKSVSSYKQSYSGGSGTPTLGATKKP
jgi:hypothetical protein